MQISRKDTVIIAVLVNGALLSCLFALASRQEPSRQDKEIPKEEIVVVQEKVVQKEAELQPLELYAKVEEKNPVDEIDKVLQEYALKQKVVTVKEAPKKVQEVKIQEPKIAKKANPAPKSSKKQEPEYYIVKKGDSPWTIARKFHLKYEDLLALNDLDEAKAKNLKIGKPIRIR